MMKRTYKNAKQVGVPFESFEDGDRCFVKLRQKWGSLGGLTGILEWIGLVVKLYFGYPKVRYNLRGYYQITACKQATAHSSLAFCP
mgnify:CR=1 FL=1